MKKSSLILFSIIFLTISINAQIKYGVTGGANFSKFIGKDSRNFNFRTGLSAGAFLEYPINEYFSFIPQLLYSVKGAFSPAQPSLATTAKRIKGNTPTGAVSGGVDFAYDVDEKYEYVDIPLFLNYSLKFGKTDRIMAFAGPSVNFLLRAQYIGKFNSSGSLADVTQTISDQKKLDLVFVFGGGVGFELVKHEAAVSFRYGFGFSPVDDSVHGYDVKNSYFSVMAGVFF